MLKVDKKEENGEELKERKEKKRCEATKLAIGNERIKKNRYDDKKHNKVESEFVNKKQRGGCGGLSVSDGDEMIECLFRMLMRRCVESGGGGIGCDTNGTAGIDGRAAGSVASGEGD